MDTGKLAGLVIDVLTQRQLQSFGNAVVAYRLRREPGDQVPNIVEHAHPASLAERLTGGKHDSAAATKALTELPRHERGE